MTVLIAECGVDDCTDPRIAKGLCNKHYQRMLRNGTTDLLVPAMQRYGPGAECIDEGCTVRPRRNGRCAVHSQMRHGMNREQQDEAKARFGGLCWLCKERPGKDFDHDHECCPGTFGCKACVRGFVCRVCNQKLRAIDDPGWLAKAFAYLEGR